MVSILRRTVDAAMGGEGGVDGPGHFARTLRALVQAGITRVIRQWVYDLVQGPKEISATEFLKNVLSALIDLPVTFMALKMSKASRTLISAAKNWEDEEVKRLGKRLKAKWHSRLKYDQSEEDSQALSDRMDSHLQKQITSGGQKQLISPQVATNDMVAEPSITKIDHNETSLEGKVAAPPIEETLMGEGSGGEEGEEDVYLKPAFTPAKRPQPTLAAPQPRPAKRGMKMKVLTGDLAEGSTAADIPGSLVTSSTKSHALHDAGQQPDGGSTDLFMPDIDLHDIPSGRKGEDKARTTVGGSEGDQMKDEDIKGGSDVVEAIGGHAAATDSPQPQLPEGEGDGLSSVMPPRVLSPVKSVAPVEDVKPESLEAPPLPSTAPSEVVTTSQPAVGFGKGLSRSIDSERQSSVLRPPLQVSSGDTTAAPKLQVLSRSSMKGSRGSERFRSVIHMNLEIDMIDSL